MDKRSVDAPTTALVASLQPWIRLLASDGASCKLKNPARTEHGVIFCFSTPFRNLMEGGDADDAAVVKLREAIDIVYRLLTLHTATALDFKDDRTATWYSLMGIGDASIKRVLERDAPFEMEVSIAVKLSKDTAVVKRKLADVFLLQLRETPSTEPTYLAAKETLDAMLQKKNPQWAKPIGLQPIPIMYWLDMERRVKMDKEQAEQIFRELVAFAHVLDTFENPQGCVAGGHLPVHVGIEALELSPLPITAAIARSVEQISDMRRVRLNCYYVTIDPRLVTCTSSELHTFLQAITKDVQKGARVDLRQQNFNLEETIPMDNEVDPVRVIVELLRPIADCENIVRLDIGGLLDLFRGPLGRVAIYQQLIDAVLVRPKPIRLIMGLAGVGDSDAALFALLVQTWRPQHPGVKLRLKSLTMDLDDMDHVFTNIVLAALDDVEEVSLNNRDENAAPISTELVLDILHKFDMLQVLSLSNVHLESMLIFSDESPRTLHTIELCALRLDDRPSFLEFVQDLGFAERPLAKQLRHFTISEFSMMEAPVTFRLTDDEAHELAWALQTNRVLHTVSVNLEDKPFLERIMLMDLLSRAAGSVMPAAVSVRRSVEERARRLAFLSVLHTGQTDSPDNMRPVLDAWLVRLVFAFSDPWVSRNIHAR